LGGHERLCYTKKKGKKIQRGGGVTIEGNFGPLNKALICKRVKSERDQRHVDAPKGSGETLAKEINPAGSKKKTAA